LRAKKPATRDGRLKRGLTLPTLVDGRPCGETISEPCAAAGSSARLPQARYAISARRARDGAPAHPHRLVQVMTPTQPRRPTERTQDIDRHVGARVRERRIMLGLTQQQLADLIGVTYQQAHKYERGINRVSAGRLFEIARVLSVPVSHFFEGLDSETGPTANPRERMCLELARNFAQISNERHQEALSQLARALATQH
jgi:transcriptional regulator with XRE-family HTH domain